MSVTANDRFKSTTGDGVTTSFDIDFPFADTSEVIVATVTNGTKSVLGSGYTITPTAKTYPSDATYPGGTIVFTTAPASGVIVQRYGSTAQTQATSINPDSTFFSSAVQNIVDKLTRLVQEVSRDLGFTVQVTPGTAQVTIPPISDGPGYLYTDGTNPYELVNELDAGSLAVSGDTANRIPYWSAAATLTSEAGFTYDPGTNTQAVENITVATNIRGTSLTASRLVVTDADKDLASSAVTATEAGYLAGVTSAIQTQLDAKLATATAQSDYSRVLARTSGLVTVGNTDVETNILSFTLTGGLLATNRAVRIRAFGNWNHDGTNSFAVYLKYGGTTVCTIWAPVDPSTASNEAFVIEAELRGNNSASAQVGVLAGTTDAWDSSSVSTRLDYGTAAEASAGDLTLTLSVKWTTADSSDTISLAAEAELI